jgi:heptosyltransferase-3
MPYDIERIKNVLVLMLDKHMGDLVLSLPAISALRVFFHDRNFSLVADHSYREIVESINGLDNLLLYPRSRLKESSVAKRSLLFLRFMFRLRDTSPDMVIDLEGRHLSSTMAFLSGAPLRVGRSTSKRPYFYNLKVHLSKGKHKAHTFTEIIEAIGVEGEIPPFRLSASESKRSSLRSILLDEGIKSKKPIVSIHPGARERYKQWTTSGFAETADWLSSEGFDVIFIGGDSDLEKIGKIRLLLKNKSFSLCGKLTLGELIALFKLSSLFIGNDSGPMHLAASAGTPVVALFSRAREDRWGPVSDRSIVLRGEEPCPECERDKCSFGFKCITTLSPGDVKSAVEKLIAAKNREHA